MLTLTTNPRTAFKLVTERDLNVEAFAKDIVLFGDSDYEGVIAAHNLALEEAQLVAELPAYKSAVQALKTHLQTSPYAKVRLKAIDYLEANLANLNAKLLQSDELSDIVKGVKILAEVADAMPKQAKGDAPPSTTLVLKIGGDAKVREINTVDNE